MVSFSIKYAKDKKMQHILHWQRNYICNNLETYWTVNTQYEMHKNFDSFTLPHRDESKKNFKLFKAIIENSLSGK